MGLQYWLDPFSWSSFWKFLQALKWMRKWMAIRSIICVPRRTMNIKLNKQTCWLHARFISCDATWHHNIRISHAINMLVLFDFMLWFNFSSCLANIFFILCFFVAFSSENLDMYLPESLILCRIPVGIRPSNHTYRGVFRTMSNIKDDVFSRKQRLIVLKNLLLRCLAVFWMHLCFQ